MKPFPVSPLFVMLPFSVVSFGGETRLNDLKGVFNYPETSVNVYNFINEFTNERAEFERLLVLSAPAGCTWFPNF